MAIDPYSSCPCQSGKKHKFCCMDITVEMEKVGTLLQNQQIKPAMKILEKLHEDHPRRSWVVNNLASILISIQRFEDCIHLLDDYLKLEPGDGGARCLMAMSLFHLGGFQVAKKALHQAIQKGAKTHGHILCWLLTSVSEQLWEENQELSARQHLALAMRFAPDESRQDLFMKMLEIEGESSVPFPLRGVHVLDAFSPNGAEEEGEYRKAMQLSQFGFFEEALVGIEKLLESHPESASLWQNKALLSAWDARETIPAEAFRAAAQRYQGSDDEKALECEVLAQILMLREMTEGQEVVAPVYEVEHLSRLLSRFDQQSRLVRMELPPPPESGHHHAPVAGYYVLDRSRPESDYKPGDQMSELPTSIGTVFLIDADGECHLKPEMTLSARAGADLETCLELIGQSAGELVTLIPVSMTQRHTESTPSIFSGMRRNGFFSKKTPGVVRLSAEKDYLDQYIKSTWLTTPQSALEGKSPAELTEMDGTEGRRQAALVVLDAYINAAGLVTDLSSISEKLKLPRVELKPVTAQTEINTFSFMKIWQLDFGSLSDDQLKRIFKRAMLMRHHDVIKRVLMETMQRPEVLSQVDQGQLLHQLTDLSRSEQDREGTLKWIQDGKQWATSQPKHFEAEMEWEMRELIFRLDDPSDPHLRGLLERIQRTYIKKLPQLKGYLDTLLRSVGVTPPWDSLTGNGEGLGGGGLWTPESQAAAATGAGGGLWLPGQD